MIRRPIRASAIIAALLMAIPIPSAAQVEAYALEDPEWHLTSFTVDGERIMVPWNVDATLRLEDGHAGGTAGCNGFGTTYELDDRDLSFGTPGKTDVGCPGPSMEVEEGYMALLPTVVSWATDSGSSGSRALHLYDRSGDIVLQFMEPTVGLTHADISQLTSLLEAQQAQIDALRQRVKELERQTG